MKAQTVVNCNPEELEEMIERVFDRNLRQIQEQARRDALPRLLTITQAAEAMQVSRPTIYNYIKAGTGHVRAFRAQVQGGAFWGLESHPFNFCAGFKGMGLIADNVPSKQLSPA
jgi:hypothetical protein